MSTQTSLLAAADAPRANEPQTMTPMALIAAAIEKGYAPDQLSALMDLQERHERNEAARQFAEALTRFQSRCPRIAKDRTAGSGAYSYQFASYDDVMAGISGLLAECGLCLSFSTTTHEKGLRVTLTIRCGTHTQDNTLDVSIPEMKVNDTQKYGAALSYAKRYALCAALNIVVTDEDNDAAGMSETITEEQCVRIQEWIAQKNVNAKKFLEWLGVESLSEIPASKYSMAIDALKRK